MSENTARVANDTAAVDAAWPQDRPCHSLIARKGVFGPDESGTFAVEPTPETAATRSVEYDVYEDARVMVVLVDVPGVGPETLSIELSTAALHVSGVIPGDPRRLSPLQPGRVAIAIEVPRGTEQDAIDASLRDGLLRIRITKPESSARPVDIAR